MLSDGKFIFITLTSGQAIRQAKQVKRTGAYVFIYKVKYVAKHMRIKVNINKLTEFMSNRIFR